MRLLPLLNAEIGTPFDVLRRIISTAPKRYKEYDIPKRTGGTRRIAHPARELKELQWVILSEILTPCPINEVASAYVRGRGILYNAKKHVGQRWLLKLDFSNFFHSIKPSDWDRTVNRLDFLKPLAQDKDDFHKILFWGQGSTEPRCLSIGAPTSPMVSNLVCHKLDEWLHENAVSRGLIVSRYADDITVSGPNIHQLMQFERALERTLEANKGLRLELNHKKRGIYGPGERRIVTGLVLTPEGKISIGRERKRTIHSLVHMFKNGALDQENAMRAKGLVAFSQSVEPDFVGKLNQKYGAEIIQKLQSLAQESSQIYSDISLD